MGTITPYKGKRGTTYRAEVYVKGRRASKTLPTKADAKAWVWRMEEELAKPPADTSTLKDAIDRFEREVLPERRGGAYEAVRLKSLSREPIAEKTLSSLSGAVLEAWRDARLAKVSAATVAREMTLVRSVLHKAVKWYGLPGNPLKGVEVPDSPPSRKRRITDAEAAELVKRLGYKGGKPETVSHRVAIAFLLALETAMRAGEILGLRWEHVSPRHVHLPMTKNGHPRDVPLSPRARELLALLPKGGETVFQLTGAQRDALFRKARDKAPAMGDLHFHDSRAEAIWRLSKHFDVLELARVIGHQRLDSLLLYYRASADELAARLDSPKATRPPRTRANASRSPGRGK